MKQLAKFDSAKLSLLRIAGLSALALATAMPPMAIASADVRDVTFNYTQLNGSRDRWLECELQLEVRRDSTDRSRKDIDFLDNLEVVLMLGIETTRGDRPSFEFYTSRATLVSLEEGRHVTRFYLPPEIVERDAMRGAPHSFIVQLGRSGEVSHEFYSPSINRRAVRDNFLKRIESLAPENEGILLPQNQTPFISSYPGSTPSYRENIDFPMAEPDS